MTKPPTWSRLNTDFFEQPGIVWLSDDRQYGAINLAIRGINYATHHLTDGWIPQSIPKRWGYRPRDWQALENVGIWRRDDNSLSGLSGWWIANYLDTNVSREEWERAIKQRRSAAFARWASRGQQ